MSRKNKHNITPERMTVERELMILKSINPAAERNLRRELSDTPAVEFKAAVKQTPSKQIERVGYRNNRQNKTVVRTAAPASSGLTQRLQLPQELLNLNGDR